MNISIRRLLAKTLLSGALLLLFCASCVGRGTPPPPIDYVKEGVNTAHLFIFTDTTMTYNGKSFMPGMTIEEMCEVFGMYNRKIRNLGHIYLWDSIGLTMTTWSREDPLTNRVNGLIIDWYVNLDAWLTPENMKRLRERCPRKYFQGNIIVGGAVLGRGMQINTFLDKTTLKFDNDPFPLLYYASPAWDYSNALINKWEYYTYMVRESEDRTDISGFEISISTRELYLISDDDQTD